MDGNKNIGYVDKVYCALERNEEIYRISDILHSEYFFLNTWPCSERDNVRQVTWALHFNLPMRMARLSHSHLSGENNNRITVSPFQCKRPLNRAYGW